MVISGYLLDELQVSSQTGRPGFSETNIQTPSADIEFMVQSSSLMGG